MRRRRGTEANGFDTSESLSTSIPLLEIGPMSPPRESDKVESPASFFRCPVQADQSRGTIRIGRRSIEASVQEASIEGFTVLVEPKYSKRLSVGIPWVLQYNGAKFEIQAQWFFHAPDGQVQIGLRRLRDLTEPEHVRSWWVLSGARRGMEDAGHSTVAFAGFVLVVCVSLALPGIGDKLGTADHINDTFRWILEVVSNRISKLM